MKDKKERLFNFLVGVDSKRDEYELQEIRQIFSWNGLGILLANNILMVIIIVMDQMNNTLSVASVGLILINSLSSLYLVIRLYGKGLNVTEFENPEELRDYKKRALRRSLIQGAYAGGFIYLLTGVIIPFFISETISLNWVDLIKSLVICTIIGGGGLYLSVHFRVKKYEEK